MKHKSILFLCLLFVSSVLHSQNVKIYYNEDWEITNADSAVFYRIAEYKNRIYNGSYTDYYVTGEIQASGYYKDGVENGMSTWYYKNGNIMCEGYYSDGKFSIYNGYDTLGNATVIDGNGYFTWLNFHNLTKSSEGQYTNGYITGPWIYYNRDGIKIEEYDADKATMMNAWDYKGQKQLVKDGNGTYVRYYQNGNIKIKGKYVNGKQDGLWTEYFENGNKNNSGTYKDGLKDGVWSYYYDRNKLQSKYRFKDDIKSGTFMSWHTNGQISSLGYYSYDYPTGKWVWFNYDGTVKSKYDHGRY